MNAESIFLTTDQAVEAICIDFRQYDPQILLFCEIVRLVSDGTVHLQRDAHKEGVWLGRPGRTRMRWLAGDELIAFMCRTIEETRWNPRLLADVCRRVFQAGAEPAGDPDTARPGVRIATNMEGYVCRQCGRCCSTLDYHDEISAGDVARWEAERRSDILRWVEVRKGDGPNRRYRIWVDPRSGKLAVPCPFLEKDPAGPRWHCQIHAVKPEICRQYPISRKHALMTGCRGFEKPEGSRSRVAEGSQ